MKIPRALLDLVEQFDQANIDYRIGGGQAAVYYGLREEAGDWDIAITAITPELKQILQQAGFTEIADSGGLSWEGPILIDFIIADGENYPTLIELGLHLADLKLKFPKRSMMGYINWKKGESAYQHLKGYKTQIEEMELPKAVSEYSNLEWFKQLKSARQSRKETQAQSSDFSESDIEKSMEDRANPIEGGVGDNLSLQDVDVAEFLQGVETEMEHVKGADLPPEQKKEIAADIAFDHLDEIDDYYTRLRQMENEAKIEDHAIAAKLTRCLVALANHLDDAGSVVEASLVDRLVGEESLVTAQTSIESNTNGATLTPPIGVPVVSEPNEWQTKANSYRREFLIEKILEKATGVAPATIRYYKLIAGAVDALGKLLDAVEPLDHHSQKYIDAHRYVQHKYNSIYDPYNTDHVPNKIRFIRELLKIDSLVEKNIDKAAKPELGSEAIVEAFVDQLKDKGYISELNKLKKLID